MKKVEGNSKIGIFDSGFGGLTIFRCIKSLLPEYEYVYLGDNARTPYGQRSFDTVLRFTTQGVDFLFAEGCRLVIIACNTASARALRSIQQLHLTQKYKDAPFLRVLGVIRPTVENIDSYSVSKVVALWATEGAVRSGSFPLEISHFAPQIKLLQVACPLLAPLVEAGELEGPGTEHFVDKYWQLTRARQMEGEVVDALLLACTHYPLLYSVIRRVVPKEVAVITQGELVAKSLQDYLWRHPEMKKHLRSNDDRDKDRGTTFYTTDRCDHFDHLAHIFMGVPVNSKLAVLL
ncbi:MAG: glutamate racemase [Oligoflexia bacterium]|nr:glutamate racemase [Oligoflexia bacterium]